MQAPMAILAFLIWSAFLFGFQKVVAEKANWRTPQRISAVVGAAIGLLIAYCAQIYRVENYTFLLGVLPSFGTALALPFIQIPFNGKYKNFLRYE